jgi:hypothetical protein
VSEPKLTWLREAGDAVQATHRPSWKDLTDFEFLPHELPVSDTFAISQAEESKSMWQIYRGNNHANLLRLTKILNQHDIGLRVFVLSIQDGLTIGGY